MSKLLVHNHLEIFQDGLGNPVGAARQLCRKLHTGVGGGIFKSIDLGLHGSFGVLASVQRQRCSRHCRNKNENR